MRAEQGKTYAQILNGKCHWIFTAEELPEWNGDHIFVVDVTGDIPSIGDAFLNGVFEPVENLQYDPTTRFSSLEFLERFTEAEQLAVVTATMGNAHVKLWYDKLLAAEYVDLADPRTEAGIDALIASGLLNASRKDEVLTPT